MWWISMFDWLVEYYVWPYVFVYEIYFARLWCIEYNVWEVFEYVFKCEIDVFEFGVKFRQVRQVLIKVWMQLKCSI